MPTLLRTFVASVGVLAAVAVGTPTQAAEPTPTLDWKPCPTDNTPRLECATLRVPLDYADPDGRTIRLAISRLPSDEPSQRRGVLLLNPGGPGGPGTSMPDELVANGIPREVLDSYDLIGFDPRGVGRSTPVSCDLTDDQTPTGNLPTHPVDAADVAERAEVVRTVAEQCASADTDGVLPHIGTANTARDMDRIRVALGVERISFYGVSYGSYLGAVYATLFPERTDRIVLDSLEGPEGVDLDALLRMAQGFEDRFPDFARWAAERHATYGLGRTPGRIEATYFELAERLDERPTADLDGALFRAYTFGTLYDDGQFPRLAELWRSVDGGNAEAVGEQGRRLAPPDDNFLASAIHVACNDADWPESVATYQSDVERYRERHPMYGAAAANVQPCASPPHEIAPQAARFAGTPDNSGRTTRHSRSRSATMGRRTSCSCRTCGIRRRRCPVRCCCGRRWATGPASSR